MDNDDNGVVVSALIIALGDKDENVRFQAADALGAIGPEAKAAVPALIVALHEPDSFTRNYVPHCAIHALVEIGPAAIPALVQALDDANGRVRSCAAWALGKIGSK